VKGEQSSQDTSTFVVEFANSDGTVFEQTANGGAGGTQQPGQTRFEYSVAKVGDTFLVHDLPVYTP